MKHVYRAWHIQEKKMYEVRQWNFDTGMLNLQPNLGFWNLNDLIIMQHIGLPDGTGKNIYADDIVELRYKLYPKKKPVICVVTWLDYKACFRAVRGNNFIANMGNTEKYHVKIIGNIHENPEIIHNSGYTIWYPMNKKQIRFMQERKEV